MISPGDACDSPQQGGDQLRAQITHLEASITALEGRISSYERIFLRSPVAAVVYDAVTFHILDANEGAAVLSGFSREDLANSSLFELFSTVPNNIRADWARSLSQPDGTLGPIMMRTAFDGEWPVTLTFFPMRTSGNTDARLAIVQKQGSGELAEEAVRASEERYRDLFENANDIIFLHDLTGKLIAVNRAAEALTGYSRTEILGKDFGMLLAPEARLSMQDNIRAHLGGSPAQHYELPVVSKTRVRRFLEVSTRILYERGHAVAVQGIGRDVTERKAAEQKLLESARELQIKNEELRKALHLAREATQMKEQFLANTSHELRTPMNGIMGMTSLLRDTPLNENQLEYVDAVSQCANDLLRIINDLLDVSQIEAGRMSITLEPFNVRESFGAVTKMLRPKAAGKGLQLTCDIAHDVPAEIVGDPLRFRQILINLVANAVKFTSSGKVQMCAEIVRNPDTLLCRVVDSGIGVEESVQHRIFEAFFQADGTLQRRYGGTGLGLTISKQLVELLGGRIGTHNNAPSPGATFWFELPLLPKPETPDLAVIHA